MTRPDARIQIGLFILVSAIVLTLLLLIARNPTLFRPGTDYFATFHSVAGLNEGDEVRYGGLVVGSVSQMEIDPSDPTRVRVRMRVRRHTPVHVDSRVSITQVGILGQPFLAIAPGQPGTSVAPPRTVLRSEENFSFQDAMTQLARFFERSDTLLGAANEFARGNPFVRLNRTLARIDTLAASANSGSAHVFARLDTTTDQLSRVIDRADRLIGVLDTAVRSSSPQLAGTQRELVMTLRETRSLVGDLREALRQGGGVDELVRNVSVASDNLARLSERLERDPTSILQKRREPRKSAGPPLQK